MHIMCFTVEIQFGADTSIASRYHHCTPWISYNASLNWD